ncbi:putative LRR receptor-like serine/threonine-protein kinase [Gossypium australe]|uniref:Putative LRR receptor-like serine/threonine-protein kinase n=1 Tax=Gossypium australe TaxID=47621 RepID=A0A5B6VIE6_9ROSI|nr:putative LRR receptor-like serine/threonine-protein kinase [Gossypium australe]
MAFSSFFEITENQFHQFYKSHNLAPILHFDHCDFLEVDPSSLSHFNFSNSLSVFHLTSSTLQPSTFPLLLNLSQKFVELDFSNNYFSGSIPLSVDNMLALQFCSFFTIKNLSHFSL